MGAELGKRNCVSMLLSGTAAGVIGAAFVAREAGVIVASSQRRCGQPLAKSGIASVFVNRPLSLAGATCQNEFPSATASTLSPRRRCGRRSNSCQKSVLSYCDQTWLNRPSPTRSPLHRSS